MIVMNSHENASSFLHYQKRCFCSHVLCISLILGHEKAPHLFSTKLWRSNRWRHLNRTRDELWQVVLGTRYLSFPPNMLSRNLSCDRNRYGAGFRTFRWPGLGRFSTPGYHHHLPHLCGPAWPLWLHMTSTALNDLCGLRWPCGSGLHARWDIRGAVCWSLGNYLLQTKHLHYITEFNFHCVS